MAEIHIVAFLLGGAQILIGIVGGGIEAWQLRIPPIGSAARIGAIVVGLLFVMIGLALSETHKPAMTPVKRYSASSCSSEACEELIQALSGSWRIKWVFEDVVHDALLRMQGQQGTMRVRLTDRKTEETASVDMTVNLEFGEHAIYLLGSNPVVSGTAQGDPNYAADSFRLSIVDGRLLFMLCDTQRRCGEVQFERVST